MKIKSWIKKGVKIGQQEFNYICRMNGLQLNYALNANELLVLKEIFVERAYADYFPFYEQATVVDVGAHVGYFSLFAAKNLAADSTIIAVEPSSKNFSVLTQNVATNQFSNIKLVHAAVSNKVGTQLLYLSKSENNSLFSDTATAASETVSTLTLDGLLQQQQLQTIDFLKLDCEGAEYDILYQTKPEILQKIKAISLEFHDLKKVEYTGLRLANYLEKQGFQLRKFEHRPTNFGLNYGKLITTR